MNFKERRISALCLALCLLIANPLTALAGGALETIDITGAPPSPVPGHISARVIGIKWDVRSIPVSYRVNNTLDPIPNPLGGAFLSLADATAVLQESFDEWNRIPTSFIDMRIVGTYGNPGLSGFDFVNELTFRTAAGFGAIASSPSVNLIVDANLDDGDDIDGDGDSDVSSSISVCADVDGDGDIEFPAGFYKAGTILDNDVQFNTKASNGVRFTIDPAQIDAVTRSVDLKSIAVHEFGHSIGLSHVLENQLSDTDGTGTTMYPFIDTGDPAAEIGQRTLGSDDIAWASYFYPEGTANTGPAALQAGDTAFDKVYGLITGELRHGVFDEPIAGGNVFAVKWGSNSVVASGYSGTTRVSYNPATGGRFLVDPAFNIIDGKYVIPVPKGSYAVGIEAVDGSPVPATNINTTTQIGALFGQQNFVEEYYNNNKEQARELRLGERKNIPIQPGRTQSGIDLTTADAISISNFGSRDFIGFTSVAPGTYYAVQIPASQVTAVNPGGDILIQGIAFDTALLDASVIPTFAQAMLTTGVVNPDNTVSIDLARPLERATGFIGQDDDFAPFYFHEPHALGRRVVRAIKEGAIENLFIVLQVPNITPFPGVSGAPPLIGLDGGVAMNDAPLFGLSFASTNGGASWARQLNFNFRFSLILSRPIGEP